MTRAENVARCQELRARGLLLREIGAELGLAVQTVSDYINDPDGTALEGRRARLRGQCRKCGSATYNGSASPPAYCHACYPASEMGRAAAARNGLRQTDFNLRARVVEMWAGGRLMREISADLGITRGHLSVLMVRMRREGYDLPYRCPPRAEKAASRR